jgi:1-hydroxycarotenoid 3,4-desaturase
MAPFLTLVSDRRAMLEAGRMVVLASWLSRARGGTAASTRPLPGRATIVTLAVLIVADALLGIALVAAFARPPRTDAPAAAVRQTAALRYGAAVERIEQRGGRVAGVVLAGGETLPADAVVDVRPYVPGTDGRFEPLIHRSSE